jgi:elongation factor G
VPASGFARDPSIDKKRLLSVCEFVFRAQGKVSDMTVPQPHILRIAIEPKTRVDEKKIGRALAKLAQEDPTLRVLTDTDSGQIIISGTGELHLEDILDRLAREYNVEANVSKPQVIYHETIRANSEAEGKYIRQTGGWSNYGHVKIRVAPNQPGKGYEFSNDIMGGAVPIEYVKAIDQGIQESMLGGVLAGYGMVDIKVSLCGGSCREVDSNEMAFKIAGSIAFKEAARKAKPVVLEPVMAVEVTTPVEFFRAIIVDLNSRRGRIEGIEVVDGVHVIKATVPLRTMIGYATAMRRLTQGYANVSMVFKQYQDRPNREDPDDDGTDAGAAIPRTPRSGNPRVANKSRIELDL